MKKPNIGQKISFFVAIVFYLAAVGCVAALLYWTGPLGSDHPIIASLSASVVFFLGAGIVLHVIGRADLPDLRIKGRDAGGTTPKESAVD